MSASTATGELTPRSAVSIALLHAKFAFLESIRIPIAVIGNLLFPALALLFFVVPTVGDDAVAATAAVGQLSVFAVMSANLFTYGAGVAEDRALPFDPFVRTLPAAAGPRRPPESPHRTPPGARACRPRSGAGQKELQVA